MKHNPSVPPPYGGKADKCKRDTFQCYKRLAEQRGLLLLKVLKHSVRFLDTSMQEVFDQKKEAFLQQRYPALLWFPEIVHHYLKQERIRYNSIHMLKGEWYYFYKNKLTSLDAALQSPPPVAKKGLYYSDENIHEYADVEGLLYMVRLQKGDETFIKVGITRQSLEQRAPGAEAGYTIIKSQVFPMMIPKAYALEQAVFTEFKEHQYWPKKKFGGYTELFNDSIATEVSRYLLDNMEYSFEEVF